MVQRPVELRRLGVEDERAVLRMPVGDVRNSRKIARGQQALEQTAEGLFAFGANADVDEGIRLEIRTRLMRELRAAEHDQALRPALLDPPEIGRASCRERVCQYV